MPGYDRRSIWTIFVRKWVPASFVGIHGKLCNPALGGVGIASRGVQAKLAEASAAIRLGSNMIGSKSEGTGWVRHFAKCRGGGSRRRQYLGGHVD